MTTNNGATMEYTYDKLRRLTEKKIVGDIKDQYTYNGGSNQIATKKVLIEDSTLREYQYAYDGNGNIVTEQDITRGYTQNYTYDVSRQLTGVSVNYGDTTRTESYSYDNAGNLTSFNNGVKSHTLTYKSSGWKDQLIAVDGETITYDHIGNPTSYYDGYRYTFEWEHGRQLKSVTYYHIVTNYEYDANGIRTKKSCSDGSSTEYYVVNGKAIGEVVKHTDGTVKYWLRYLFDESGQIIGYSYWALGDTAWSEYYFAKNLQGDVVGVYRASDNAQVAFYEYDAWGNIIYKSGDMADINPFRYRTYYYDNETWFYYLQSRYYDPAIGRFINADDIIAKLGNVHGTNMFTYCMNNPVNMSDSSGNWPLLATFAAVAIAVAVSSAVNHIINAVNKKKIDAEIKSSYSVEEATIAINDVVQKYSTDSYVKFDVPREDGLLQVEITESYNVTSRYDRQKVCAIIENTTNNTGNITTREYDNMSAEWLFHNLATPIPIYAQSASDVGIDYSKDLRLSVRIFTKILEIGGWE